MHSSKALKRASVTAHNTASQNKVKNKWWNQNKDIVVGDDGVAVPAAERNKPKRIWRPAVPNAVQAASLPIPAAAFPKKRRTLYGPFLCGPQVTNTRSPSMALQDAKDAFAALPAGAGAAPPRPPPSDKHEDDKDEDVRPPAPPAALAPPAI